MKLLLVVAISLVLFLIPCCNSSQENSNEPGQGEPESLDLSFPDGAPPLNQTAELVCTIRSSFSLTDLSVDISLPEGFELVSGELSWRGDILRGDEVIAEVEVIRAIVRSVEVGNWIITCSVYLNPEKNVAVGWDGGLSIYVSVFEDSAEWAYWRLWDRVDDGLPIEVVD